MRKPVDMEVAVTKMPFVERYSIWKTLGLALIVLALAILPMTPRFEEGLRHTAALYKLPFYPILFASCIIMGLIFVGLLPLLYRAITKKPAIEITSSEVVVHVFGKKSMRIAEIGNIDKMVAGNLILRGIGGGSLTAPVYLYRDSQIVFAKLHEILR